MENPNITASKIVRDKIVSPILRGWIKKGNIKIKIVMQIMGVNWKRISKSSL